VPQAVPIDPSKLIEAAEELANHKSGAGRPRPVWLRRAVSTAYYGLYHCICLEAARHMLPNGRDEQQLWMARAFGHAEIKECCAWIDGRQGCSRKRVVPLVRELKTASIAGVAGSFCDLQEARHRADYDHLAVFSKATTVAHIADARSSISQVLNAPQDERAAFFSLLALRAKVL
jgi:hypothetical protein